MRYMLIIPALLLPTGYSQQAIGQQYYSFEEACRMAGQTTGPCAPKSEEEQYLGCINGDRSAFHAEKFADGCVETNLSPVFDSEIFVELIGLQNIAKINELGLTIGRSAGYNNAVALFHNRSRMIIHDPEWARSATAESYLVLGHEAGHHFCGHLLVQDPVLVKQQELEADRFAGASIRRFEIYHSAAFLDGAISAANRLYSDSESRSHPPKMARIEAIMVGYNSGSPCGDLAAGIQGYSPQPR